MGVLVFSEFIFIIFHGLPPSTSIAVRWMIVGPAYFIAMLGLVLCVGAMIGQKRYWWLALPGLLLNGLPMGVAALLLLSRLR